MGHRPGLLLVGEVQGFHLEAEPMKLAIEAGYSRHYWRISYGDYSDAEHRAHVNELRREISDARHRFVALLDVRNLAAASPIQRDRYTMMLCENRVSQQLTDLCQAWAIVFENEEQEMIIRISLAYLSDQRWPRRVFGTLAEAEEWTDGVYARQIDHLRQA